MGWLKRLFEFRGRARRREYYLLFYGLGILSLLLILPFETGFGPSWIGWLIGLPFDIAIVALIARRLHDRNRLAWPAGLAAVWFIGVDYVPGLNEIWRAVVALPAALFLFWMLIEVAFLPGTRGPNRFGDPRGPSNQTLPEGDGGVRFAD